MCMPVFVREWGAIAAWCCAGALLHARARVLCSSAERNTKKREPSPRVPVLATLGTGRAPKSHFKRGHLDRVTTQR